MYLARKFLHNIFVVYIVIISTFSVVDLVEILRRASNKKAGLLEIISHTTLQIPFVIQETFVLTIFVASIYTFLQLSKSNEYTIIKSSGVSIWQFLAPFLITSAVLSMLILTVINPLSSVMLIKQQRVLDRILSGNKSTATAVFESGFWLIDEDPNQQRSLIINSDLVIIDKKETMLRNVSILQVDSKFNLERTLESDTVSLNNGYWELHNTTEYIAKSQPKKYELLSIPTTLTQTKLESNFRRPDLISIWELPYFMTTLKATGHSAKAYLIYFHKLFIKPFLGLTLICIAASFTLHPFRNMKIAKSLLGCGLLAFAIYTSLDLSYLILKLPPFNISAAIIFLSLITAILTVRASRV